MACRDLPLAERKLLSRSGANAPSQKSFRERPREVKQFCFERLFFADDLG
jgi:hypothetical protein